MYEDAPRADRRDFVSATTPRKQGMFDEAAT